MFYSCDKAVQLGAPAECTTLAGRSGIFRAELQLHEAEVEELPRTLAARVQQARVLRLTDV